MNIKELRKLNTKQLEEKRKEIEFLVMSSYTKVHPKLIIGQRREARRTIQQINTLLKEKEIK